VGVRGAGTGADPLVLPGVPERLPVRLPVCDGCFQAAAGQLAGLPRDRCPHGGPSHDGAPRLRIRAPVACADQPVSAPSLCEDLAM
jgi:hypothetical protein